MKKLSKQEADICLILEGSYPYVLGGVSTWAHRLIESLPDFSFTLVCLVPPKHNLKLQYKLPKNVIGLQTIALQEIDREKCFLSTGKIKKFFSSKKRLEGFFKQLEFTLIELFTNPSLEKIEKLNRFFNEYRDCLGRNLLLNSFEAWVMLIRIYNMMVSNSGFLTYFWTWRTLFGSLFSVFLAPLVPAKVYHALSTGYAGLYLAKAHLENKKATCYLTEHGIYTIERRIEVTVADWISKDERQNLSMLQGRFQMDIRDFLIKSFTSFSKVCYDSCDKIITLYQGNQKYQLQDGADPSRLMIVRNGVDLDKYADVVRDHDHPPTVAVIGRVVPIKDIKCFIYAVKLLKGKIPHLKALVIGPGDEDPEYYQECLFLQKQLNLEDVLEFTGKADIKDYLPIIDVHVLTSISEVQPLTVLETGICKIPNVTTDVGSCREIIYGTDEEKPKIGDGGFVTQPSNPKQIADAIYTLLSDEKKYKECSQALFERIKKYYNKKNEIESYQAFYQEGTLSYEKNKAKTKEKVKV